MGSTRRSAAVAGGTPAVLEHGVLVAVHRELALISQALMSAAESDAGAHAVDRADVVSRIDLCAEVARAIAARTDPLPARRLLALGTIGAIGLDLAGLQVDRHIGPLPAGLAPETADVAEQAFACVISNVHAHARARHAVVALITSDDTVQLAVADDGCGFDLDDVEHPTDGGTTTLQAVRHAVQAIGGSFEVATSPGRGTQVTVRLPRPSSERDQPCLW